MSANVLQSISSAAVVGSQNIYRNLISQLFNYFCKMFKVTIKVYQNFKTFDLWSANDI